MSAQDNPNSKVPPSLLSSTAESSTANGSRILANLEGRVEPAAAPRRRNRGPAALVLLLLIAAGGWGAWRWQQGAAPAAQSAPPARMAAAATNDGAQPAAPAPKVAAASVPAAQPATIVADDDSSKNDSAAQGAASASAAPGEDRLSRALSNGASTSAAATAATTTATTAAAATDGHGKSDSLAHTNLRREALARHEADRREALRREAAERKHAKEHPTALARAGASDNKTKQQRKIVKEDTDAELLAALVARTAPAHSAGSTARGAKAAHGAASKREIHVASAAPLAQQVKACGEHGFFEEQLCRWRVCDGHWGKDPACPSGGSSQASAP